VPEQSLLKRVVEALDAARVSYMLSGSLASSLQANPGRLTTSTSSWTSVLRREGTPPPSRRDVA